MHWDTVRTVIEVCQRDAIGAEKRFWEATLVQPRCVLSPRRERESENPACRPKTRSTEDDDDDESGRTRGTVLPVSVPKYDYYLYSRVRRPILINGVARVCACLRVQCDAMRAAAPVRRRRSYGFHSCTSPGVGCCDGGDGGGGADTTEVIKRSRCITVRRHGRHEYESCIQGGCDVVWCPSWSIYSLADCMARVICVRVEVDKIQGWAN